MEVIEAIEKRRSVRVYQDKPIPEEKLKKILEAARLAPSARNSQDYQLVVLKNEKIRKKIASEATSHSFIGAAPVILVAVSLNPEYIMPGGIPAHPIDIAIAVDHMTLVAVEEGLASCWIGAFNQRRIKEILGIPDRYRVVVLLSLGYPAENPKRKLRKLFKEIISYDCFLK